MHEKKGKALYRFSFGMIEVAAGGTDRGRPTRMVSVDGTPAIRRLKACPQAFRPRSGPRGN